MGSEMCIRDSILVLLYLHQVVNPVDHAADGRCIFHFHGVTDFTETQALDAQLVLGLTADGAAGQCYFDRFCVRHDFNPESLPRIYRAWLQYLQALELPGDP